jgi:hypothetical protein
VEKRKVENKAATSMWKTIPSREKIKDKFLILTDITRQIKFSSFFIRIHFYLFRISTKGCGKEKAEMQAEGTLEVYA